jgi:hypothetical protein
LDFLPHEISLLTELRSKPPKWKGPLVDGVSQSLLNEWIQDPYTAYLSLVLGLDEPRETPEPGTPYFNLIWGDSFHVGLEHLIETRNIQVAVPKMLARLKEHPPISHKDIDIESSLVNMLNQYSLSYLGEEEWKTEVKFDVNIQETQFKCSLPFRLRGKLDGLSASWESMAEHKCKGYIKPETLKYELKLDTQTMLYAGIYGPRLVHYDLILIPEAQKPWVLPTRRLKQSKEDFTNQIYYGHNGAKATLPIHQYRQNWVSQQPINISDEDVNNFWYQTFIPLLHRMHEWYEYVTDPKFDICDPACYNSTFYRFPLRTFMPSATDSFKRKMYNVLVGIDGIENLPIKENFFEELE